ncbi:hypothetical protein U9M48_027434 [Paspalum notatum var. saurae]|uniref:Uncharacterized protein n=1 Tax=Paspalum notatum var. saurae TaxID=547442 RepID=A0AAQ3X030_PASNO
MRCSCPELDFPACDLGQRSPMRPLFGAAIPSSNSLRRGAPSSASMCRCRPSWPPAQLATRVAPPDAAPAAGLLFPLGEHLLHRRISDLQDSAPFPQVQAEALHGPGERPLILQPPPVPSSSSSLIDARDPALCCGKAPTWTPTRCSTIFSNHEKQLEPNGEPPVPWVVSEHEMVCEMGGGSRHWNYGRD